MIFSNNCQNQLSVCLKVQGPNYSLIASVTMAVIIALLMVVAFFVYRYYKEEAAIASMHWKISTDEIMATKGSKR